MGKHNFYSSYAANEITNNLFLVNQNISTKTIDIARTIELNQSS